MGLFMGVSIVSFVEVLYWIYRASAKICSAGSAKPKKKREKSAQIIPEVLFPTEAY